MAEMLTTSGAAARLGVSERRVRALIKAGRLAATKSGRDWLIAEVDLEAVRVRTPGRPPADKNAVKDSEKKSRKKG